MPAVEAADTGTKAANVSLLGYGNVDAGLITVKFCGDVAAVEAAVTAAAGCGKQGWEGCGRSCDPPASSAVEDWAARGAASSREGGSGSSTAAACSRGKGG